MIEFRWHSAQYNKYKAEINWTPLNLSYHDEISTNPQNYHIRVHGVVHKEWNLVWLNEECKKQEIWDKLSENH